MFTAQSSCDSDKFFPLSAVHSGTEMLELDVHLTADGQVVVTHDNDLGRICGVKQRICDTNYEVGYTVSSTTAYKTSLQSC